MDDLALYSPEEVSKLTRGKISPWTLKRLARDGEVDCVRAERDKILFTKDQIRSIILRWSRSATREPVAPEVAESRVLFQGTGRSRKAHGF